MNETSKVVRIATGVALAAAPLLAGALQRSAWLIAFFVVAYAALYIHDKWTAWRPLLRGGAPKEALKALGVTALAQLLIVGLLYLTGFGLSAAVTGDAQTGVLTWGDVAFAAALTVAAFGAGLFIKRLEQAPTGRGTSKTSDTPELEPIDEATFFTGRHFSISDHARAALFDGGGRGGRKIERRPKAASDKMIAEAEERLGVKLPEALRTLYRRQDGGALGEPLVALKPDPQDCYEDWAPAFSGRYNDLRPLRDLQTLRQVHLEHFDHCIKKGEEPAEWGEGTEKIVFLDLSDGAGAALDYRLGDAPQVALIELDEDGAPSFKLSFADFAAFFAALRREAQDGGPAETVLGAPDLTHPDQFWAVSHMNSSRGVASDVWRAQEERLGVALPEELAQLYRAVDGGWTPFNADARRVARTAGGAGEGFERVVPLVDYPPRGVLAPVEKWVSLRALSDRLDFVGDQKPWSQIWLRPERLIVLSAARDGALMLDYRDGESPAVLWAPDLDDPSKAVRYKSAGKYLASLRAAGAPGSAIPDFLGDPRLSARTMSEEAFWRDVGAQEPVSSASLKAFEIRFGQPLGKELAALLALQNGGAPRFRFLSPAGTGVREWVDLFPGGVAPIEQWSSFDLWREEAGLALGQEAVDLAAPEFVHAAELRPQLVVIGAQRNGEQAALTLLDASTTAFRSAMHLLRVDYDREAGAFGISLPHRAASYAPDGVFRQLRALRAELAD